jgi:hypothetical protein
MKKTRTKAQRKKTAAVIIAAACGLCIVGLFFLNTGDLTFDFSTLFNTKETTQVVYSGDGNHRISLYEPDWESNIFENREYLEKNRYITYVEGGMAITIVDGDYESFGEPVEMFAGYIDALTHGDAEAVNSYYADSYFKTHEPLEAITMQKLYNIKVEFISKNDINDPAKGIITRYFYKLTYMIMENDGTFRNDLISDAEKPQFYELIDDGTSIKIVNVLNYYLPQ